MKSRERSPGRTILKLDTFLRNGFLLQMLRKQQILLPIFFFV